MNAILHTRAGQEFSELGHLRQLTRPLFVCLAFGAPGGEPAGRFPKMAGLTEKTGSGHKDEGQIGGTKPISRGSMTPPARQEFAALGER